MTAAPLPHESPFLWGRQDLPPLPSPAAARREPPAKAPGRPQPGGGSGQASPRRREAAAPRAALTTMQGLGVAMERDGPPAAAAGGEVRQRRQLAARRRRAPQRPRPRRRLRSRRAPRPQHGRGVRSAGLRRPRPGAGAGHGERRRRTRDGGEGEHGVRVSTGRARPARQPPALEAPTAAPGRGCPRGAGRSPLVAGPLSQPQSPIAGALPSLLLSPCQQRDRCAPGTRPSLALGLQR